eukprot:ctg_1132.g362
MARTASGEMTPKLSPATRSALRGLANRGPLLNVATSPHPRSRHDASVNGTGRTPRYTPSALESTPVHPIRQHIVPSVASPTFRVTLCESRPSHAPPHLISSFTSSLGGLLGLLRGLALGALGRRHRAQKRVVAYLHRVDVENALRRGHEPKINQVRQRPHRPVHLERRPQLLTDHIRCPLRVTLRRLHVREEHRGEHRRPQQLIDGHLAHHRCGALARVGHHRAVQHVVPIVPDGPVQQQSERGHARRARRVPRLAVQQRRHLRHQVTDGEPEKRGQRLDLQRLFRQALIIARPERRQHGSRGAERVSHWLPSRRARPSPLASVVSCPDRSLNRAAVALDSRPVTVPLAEDSSTFLGIHGAVRNRVRGAAAAAGHVGFAGGSGFPALAVRALGGHEQSGNHAQISPSVPLPQVVLSYIGDGQGLWIEDMHSYRLSEPYVIHFRSHPNMFQEYTETRGVCHFVEEDVVDEEEEEEEAEEGRDEDLEDEEEEDEEEQAAREILRYVKSLNVQGKQTRVVIEGEVDVYVPVLGGLVESFVVSNLRGFYTRFPSLVHGYIAYREQQKAGAPLPMPLANGAAAAGGLHGEHSADEAEAAAAEAPAGA